MHLRTKNKNGKKMKSFLSRVPKEFAAPRVSPYNEVGNDGDKHRKRWGWERCCGLGPGCPHMQGSEIWVRTTKGNGKYVHRNHVWVLAGLSGLEVYGGCDATSGGRHVRARPAHGEV
jgi:hypothetical protein